MDLTTILSSLRRSSVGAVLIAAQAAITVAIVTNVLYFVHRQAVHMRAPTGLEEANVVFFDNSWVQEAEDAKSRLQADLATLRALPGVQSAFATDGLPLRGSGFTTTVSVRPNDRSSEVLAALYPVDDQALATLGLRLVAGRWFSPGEIIDRKDKSDTPDRAAVVVITHALAQRLFPSETSVGKIIFLQENPATVIGVIQRLRAQTPWAYGADDALEYSVLSPYLWAAQRSQYVLRVAPENADSVLRRAQEALLSSNQMRILSGSRTFPEARATAYRPLRAMSLMLTAVGAALMMITSLGIFGLTSYWVATRRRQIGIRRALGARRSHILRQFLLENLLISGLGASVGVLLTLLLSHVTLIAYEMVGVPLVYSIVGAVIVIGLSQLSALRPAWRAASVSPAMATRLS